jgi:hypothetical protein
MDVKFALEVSGRAYLEHLHQPRTKVELTKGARGEYRWTVEVSDPVPAKAVQVAMGIERTIADEYGKGEEAEGVERG